MNCKSCGLLLLLAATGCWAQTDSLNTLSVGLNFLTHGEVCGGGLPRGEEGEAPSSDHSSFLLGRTRINIDYERQGLQAHAVIQNKAVWGTSGSTDLKLYEGWVKLAARCGLFAQVGRVALSYDDERIIGPNDFAMAALSHDVLRVGYQGYGHQLHAILAYNQNSENVYRDTYYRDGSQFYKTMQTVWYHYDVPKIPLGVSLLFMNYGLQAGENDPNASNYKSNPAHMVQQQMFGGHVKFHPKYLTLEGSYYRQKGMEVNEDMYAGKIDAWMASAKATVNPTDRYGFVLGYDHLSGDDFVPVPYGGQFGLPRHEVNKAFSPLFGSRVEFYGMMDYFYKSAYSHGFSPGLQNLFGGVSGKPVSKLDCSAVYHYLATATKLDKLNRTLGHAIELEATYTFTKDIALTASYTLMIGTETMDRLKQGDASKYAQWGWFSLVISPSLFTTKW
jgi:hypothetical protein